MIDNTINNLQNLLVITKNSKLKVRYANGQFEAKISDDKISRTGFGKDLITALHKALALYVLDE